jgi:Fe-S cluster assembly iron-binding protein IscA
MLTLTDAASSHLAQLLDAASAPEDVAVRVVAEGPGLAMRMDNERPGDETHDHDGRTVLLLDGQVAGTLAERTLDVQQTGEGPRLALR